MSTNEREVIQARGGTMTENAVKPQPFLINRSVGDEGRPMWEA